VNDDSAKSGLNISEVSDITRQLNNGRLSRRGLRERLTALGVGFGAAFVLGLTGAQATPAPEATVRRVSAAIFSVLRFGYNRVPGICGYEDVEAAGGSRRARSSWRRFAAA